MYHPIARLVRITDRVITPLQDILFRGDTIIDRDKRKGTIVKIDGGSISIRWHDGKRAVSYKLEY